MPLIRKGRVYKMANYRFMEATKPREPISYRVVRILRIAIMGIPSKVSKGLKKTARAIKRVYKGFLRLWRKYSLIKFTKKIWRASSTCQVPQI